MYIKQAATRFVEMELGIIFHGSVMPFLNVTFVEFSEECKFVKATKSLFALSHINNKNIAMYIDPLLLAV